MAECRLHLCHKGMADSYTAPLEDFKKDANGARAPMGHFRCSAERAKRFVNVNLHCNVSTLKTISKMSTLPPSGKFLRMLMAAFDHLFSKLWCTAIRLRLR